MNINALKIQIVTKYKNQAQFGRAIGMTRSTINKYLRGTRKPNIKTIMDMSAALDIPLTECISVFYGSDYAKPKG